MPPRLYLASSNRGKLRELAALAEAEGVELFPLPNYDRLPRFPEREASFALNALEKAFHYSRLLSSIEPPGSSLGEATSFLCADDSGLLVDALDGRPGVRSARYAGPQATDEDNNRKLLEELRGQPEDRRGARYVCAIALARQERILGVFSGACEGRILEAPRGRGGFGFDPLFFFPPLGKTMAEISVEEKNHHSHRGKAFRKLLDYLKEHASARQGGKEA